MMIPSLVLAAAASVGAGAPAKAQPEPFTCRMNALNRSERERQRVLLAKVRSIALKMHELPNGLAVSLPATTEVFREAAEGVSLERRCCPFVDFALEWRRDDTVAVKLTGEPGVKEFIAAEMGIEAGR